jgi:hypothetical protein
MHPQITSALAEQHRRDLVRAADRRRLAASLRGPRRHAVGLRVPRYRLSWSRVSLSPAGVAGPRERSWIIVISATRGHQGAGLPMVDRYSPSRVSTDPLSLR